MRGIMQRLNEVNGSVEVPYQIALLNMSHFAQGFKLYACRLRRPDMSNGLRKFIVVQFRVLFRARRKVSLFVFIARQNGKLCQVQISDERLESEHQIHLMLTRDKHDAV